jgi:amino acid adenylation domain-containing protein
MSEAVTSAAPAGAGLRSERIEGIYPLSPVQQGMLFECLYRHDPDRYVAQQSFVFEDLDPGLLAAAWRRLLDHHSILRTGFVWEGLELPVQAVLRRVELPLREHDLRALPDEARRPAAARLLAADRMTGFDLRQAPLLRLTLCRLDERVCELACTFHHLIQDGWSQTLIMDQFARLYRELAAGGAGDLGPRRPFSAYLEWLGRQDRSHAEAYWRRTLAGFTAATPLGEDGPGELPAGGGGRQRLEQLRLPPETGAALRALARRSRLTLNTVMQGAWALLLARESGSSDVVFGVTLSGRPGELPGVETTAGPFVNVLPLRARLAPRAPLLGWLRELQERQLELRQVEHSSLVEVHGWSEVPRGQPLFASVVSYQSRPAALGALAAPATPHAAAGAAGPRLLGGDGGAGATGFPLIFEVDPGAEVTVTLHADRGNFSAARTRALLQLYGALLEELAARPEADLGDLTGLNASGGEAATAARAASAPAAPAASGARVRRELRLPFERPEAGRPGAGGQPEVAVDLPPAVAAGVASLAAERRTTAEVVALAAWYALLWRLTGQPSPLVALLAGQAPPLPLAVDLDVALSFGELVERLAACLAAVRRGLQQPGLPRQPESRDPFPFTCELGTPGGTAGTGGAGSAGSVVHLACRPDGAGLTTCLRYDPSLLTAADAERLAGELQAVLASAARRPAAPLHRLDMVGEAERRWLLHELNRTAAPAGGEVVHELFAAQARSGPAREAVVAGEQVLTYEELDRQANQLARTLRRLGVGADDLVGVCVDRSAARVVSVLGALKAGAAYLPLEPAHPLERMRVILEEALPSLVLVERAFLDRLPAGGPPAICLDEAWAAAAAESAANPGSWAIPANRACVLYTSGSTGTPKGVMLTHRSVCNHLLWARRTWRLQAGDRVLHNVAFNFDVSVLELFGPLVSGAAIVLSRPGGQRDSAYLARTLRDERVCAAFFVPSMLRFLLREPAFSECAHLRMLWCGGEPIPADLRDLFTARSGAEMGNLYAPTETTINSTYWECRSDPPGSPVPLGRPIANTRLYVVDGDFELVPTGAAGELLIGGTGVSRGYLRQPGRTAASFLPDPWSEVPGQRLYRSGDLVRRRPDGAVDYLGRKDFQVKIRGLRIELGEVEAALCAHPGVSQAVAAVREDVPGDRRLVAYVVGPGTAAPGAAELRAHLQARLPDYMVPAAYVTLPEMPLSPNGKIDRRALPAPGREQARAGLDTPYAAPRNPVEELLCEIWSGMLGTEPIGVEDDFFQLGGHSLLVLQLLSRLRDAFAVELPLDAVFDAPTVAAQAAVVAAALQAGTGRAAPPVTPSPRGGPLPLSFAQQRLWFLDQLDPGTAAYNVPYAVRLEGRLAVAALAAALQEVVRRHEVLRARFVKLAGGPAQVFDAPGPLALPVADLACLPAAARRRELGRLAAAEARRQFDLAGGRLLRAGLLRLGAEEHVALLTLHHVVGDAWSMNLLLRELTALYQAFAAGRPSPLGALAVQYADYAVWQRGWLQGEVLEEHLSYWRRQLAGAPQELGLPSDLPPPAVAESRGWRGASQSRSLPPELSRAVKALGRREGVTVFMTVLAAISVVLSHVTGKADVVVGSNAANRVPLESEGLIGFFINLLALRCDLSGDPSFRELLARVRAMTLGAYAHQQVPFETVVHDLQLERRAGGTPLIQAVVDFQTVAAAPPELPGLTLQALPDVEEVAKFDLVFILADSGTGLDCTLLYRVDLFFAATIAQWLESFELCLAMAAADPEVRVSGLCQRLAERDRERTAAAREHLSQRRRRRLREGRPAPVPATLVEGGE